MISGKNIVIGVTGGIAAYKAVHLVRSLQKSGANVRVTMTEAATRFVGRDTFASLTRHSVPVRIFPENSNDVSENWTQHIHWAEWADVIAVVPCTANTLANIVHGFSDSMLTATILAARCPILICPSMDGEMYKAPATRSNLHKAARLGFHLMEPASGYLASGLTGTGRLPEPEEIADHIHNIVSSSPEKDQTTAILSKKKVVVTAGATREFIDPVRFISNPSTGKMGLAMAEAANFLGAQVTLLHAESIDADHLPSAIEKKSFVDTEDLFHLVQTHADNDIIIMTAAVSDFRPVTRHPQKVKKEFADEHLDLERTPDILKWLGDRRKNEQVLIGFAMESENLLVSAREKRIKKNVDWMAANDLSADDAGFAVDTNRIVLIGKHDEIVIEGLKSDVAKRVLHHIFVS